MFLFENDIIANLSTIRGVQYITVSIYGGEKDIFQKVGDLIMDSYPSSKTPDVTTESLSNLAMALPDT